MNYISISQIIINFLSILTNSHLVLFADWRCGGDVSSIHYTFNNCTCHCNGWLILVQSCWNYGWYSLGNFHGVNYDFLNFFYYFFLTFFVCFWQNNVFNHPFLAIFTECEVPTSFLQTQWRMDHQTSRHIRAFTSILSLLPWIISFI